ncbi:MAG TPA: PilZ domain-containing protein [Geminicoccaceae bacterium]|nr:PilZ domain-containing protein [Geminicoccaceae bacterium]
MSATASNPSDRPSGTATEERLDPRYEGRLEAFVMFRGAPWRCWICDLSLGGAGLEPALPAMLGQEVELCCPRFDFAGGLPGRVINVAERRTCVAFQLDPEHLDALARFLAANIDIG